MHTMKDEVLADAASNPTATTDGIKMLGLRRHLDQGEINGIANRYIVALQIIRELSPSNFNDQKDKP